MRITFHPATPLFAAALWLGSSGCVVYGENNDPTGTTSASSASSSGGEAGHGGSSSSGGEAGSGAAGGSGGEAGSGGEGGSGGSGGIGGSSGSGSVGSGGAGGTGGSGGHGGSGGEGGAGGEGGYSGPICMPSTSTDDAQCPPWNAGDVHSTLGGVLMDHNENEFVYRGSGLCSVTSASQSGITTWLKLACNPEKGHRVGPNVDIVIESEIFKQIPAALSPGASVRLYFVHFFPDDDGTEAEAYVLKDPDDGRLLLTYADSFFPISNDTLAHLGLTAAGWYAPLEIGVKEDSCGLVPDKCDNLRTRAGLTLSAPGADPAIVFDHGQGHVGSLYGVHVGQLERLPVDNYCVDSIERTYFLIYALDPPCNPTPADVCNGVDDDGDGKVDESDPATGTPCIWPAPGACSMGVTACVDGALVCHPPSHAYYPAATEVCNNIDDDCDGIVDESPSPYVSPYSCDTGQPGRCAPGKWACKAGGTSCAALAGPALETCNGIDDDCNGLVDDACAPPAPETCLTGGIGVCAFGLVEVDNGVTTCVPTDTPSTEVCDGKDNDCNGKVDDGPFAGPCDTGLLGVCGVGYGWCEEGMYFCEEGSPYDELCDGLDNDCDGEVDEGLMHCMP